MVGYRLSLMVVHQGALCLSPTIAGNSSPFVGSGGRFQGLLSNSPFASPFRVCRSYNRIFVGSKFLSHYRVTSSAGRAFYIAPSLDIGFDAYGQTTVPSPRKTSGYFHVTFHTTSIVFTLTTVLIAISPTFRASGFRVPKDALQVAASHSAGDSAPSLRISYPLSNYKDMN